MKIKAGCSLPYGLFSGKPSRCSVEFMSAFGSLEKILEFSSQHFDCIELRIVRKDSDPDLLLAAIGLIESRGLEVSIHGELCDADTFFHIYKGLLCKDSKRVYNVTVHPLEDMESTLKNLREICARIDEEKLPLFITLENQRIKPKRSYGKCGEILAAVKAVGASCLGICFDFGHQLSNEKNGISDTVEDEFISRVRHTHVHSFCGGRTHFPLTVGQTALDKNLMRLLSCGYGGILCLELSPERYAGELALIESLSDSAKIIRVAARQTEIKKQSLEFYKGVFFDAIKDVKRRFDEAKNCVALVGHAGYIIKFGATQIAVDLAPKSISLGDKAREFISEWASGSDAYILTHAHVDHYESEFIAGLPDSIDFLVPDFMELEKKRVTRVKDGDLLEVGEVKLGFFRSGHTLSDRVVEEYGFYVEYGGEKYVFPVDVRDYDFDYPHFDGVRALFAHLWLGRKMALKTYDGEYAEKFCRFVEKFGAENCYVSHLNDVHRNIDSMWSEIHFDMIKEKLPNAQALKAPDIAVFL